MNLEESSQEIIIKLQNYLFKALCKENILRTDETFHFVRV